MNQFQSKEAKLLFLAYTLRQSDQISQYQKEKFKDLIISKDNTLYDRVPERFSEEEIRVIIHELIENVEQTQSDQLVKSAYTLSPRTQMRPKLQIQTGNLNILMKYSSKNSQSQQVLPRGRFLSEYQPQS